MSKLWRMGLALTGLILFIVALKRIDLGAVLGHVDEEAPERAPSHPLILNRELTCKP
jgi:hypothetical protein